MEDNLKNELRESTGGAMLYKMGRIEEAVNNMAENINKQTKSTEKLHDRMDVIERAVDQNTKDITSMTERLDLHMDVEEEHYNRIAWVENLRGFGKTVLYIAGVVITLSGAFLGYQSFTLNNTTQSHTEKGE